MNSADGLTVPRTQRVLVVVFRVLVGSIFVWASIDKILYPEEFARAVANYRLLPVSLIHGFALLLPWVEFFCGTFLILGQWQQSASFVLTCVLAVFIIAVGASMVRNLDIHCGCFDTTTGRKVGLQLLIEDLFLFGVTIFLTMKSPNELGRKAFLGTR